MHTIFVPIEKCITKSPSDEKDTDYTVVNETEQSDRDSNNHRRGGTEINDSTLKSILRRTDKEDVEREIPPAYVIWVQYMGQEGGGGPPSPYDDSAEPLVYDPKTRNSFVRKVFTVVFLMLVATVLVAAVIHIVPSSRRMFMRHWLMIVLPCMFVLIGVQYAIFCSTCARKSPMSVVLLILVTLATGVLTAAVTLFTRTIVIYCVLAATAVVVFVCIILAMSSFDFTKYMLYIVIVSVGLCAIMVIFAIVRFAFNIEMKPLHIGILIIATLVSMIVFAMELQLILGGRTVELSVDEWALAALMVYLSILDIFLKLLALGNLFDR